MLNRIAFYCCLPFMLAAAVMLSLPTFAQAAAVDVSSVAIGLADVLPTLVQLGGAGLLIWALIGAYTALRDMIGTGASKASPISSPEFKQQAYLQALADQLATENAVSAHQAAGDLTPTYRPATMEEQASWDRVEDKREQYANDKAREALSAYEWQTDTDGVLYRNYTITVMGKEKTLRFDYADEFNQAREEALDDYDMGRSNAQMSSDKEDRKDLDMQAMRGQ